MFLFFVGARKLLGTLSEKKRVRREKSYLVNYLFPFRARALISDIDEFLVYYHRVFFVVSESFRQKHANLDSKNNKSGLFNIFDKL